MAALQIFFVLAIALALECVPPSYSIDLFSDSQAALDACKLKLDLVYSDFRNQFKGHLGVLDNKCANELARAAVLSSWNLPYSINKYYLKVGGAAISVVIDSLHADIDWFRSSLVWHPDSHMAAGFISKQTAGFQTYFMKALHFQLSVVMHKQLYNKSYSSVVCLFYGDIEVLNHAFSCLFDANNHAHLLDSHGLAWGVRSSLGYSFSVVSQLLFTCLSDILVSTGLYKSFVLKNWFHKSVSVFKDSKVASQKIVAFVHEFSHAFWENIWLVYAKHRAFMEKNGLIPHDRSVFISIFGLPSVLLVGMIRLLGIAKAIGVGFGFCKSCLFFLDINDEVSVYISV
ncbi:hypothetical protein G9A89_006470 [Geosiphon pyriformis]|nr:hypothetical protein G9A89_006470 [Geosiphon pyriformis]